MSLRHRRLFLLSLSTLLSVFTAQALPHAVKAFFFWGLLLAFTVLLVLFLCGKLRLTAVLALFLSALAFLSSYQVSSKSEAIAPYDERTLPVSVTLVTVTARTEESVRGVGSVSLPDESGRRISVRVRVSAPVSATAGCVLYGDAFLSSPKSSYDEASGLYGSVSFRTCRIVDRLYGPRYAIGVWRELLAERLRAAAPGETGELLCALLLGVRDGLSDGFVRDMSRIGTTHILSLSGLHLAILTGGVGALLRRFALGKRLRLGLLALFAVAFMIFTGLSPSVMRAGFMLLFSTLPVFLREERDSLSSLGAAVAIICLCEPYAVRDVSLWLSALSTLGILLLFERIKGRRTEESPTLWRRLGRAVLLSLAVTVSASVATLPLTLALFETVPLLSPLANLLLGVPVQILLYLALVLAFVGGFPPLAALAEGLASLIALLARLLADIPNAVLSAPTGGALVFVSLLSCGALLYLLLCPRKKFRALVPLALCASILVTSVLPPVFARLARGDRLSLFYASDEETGTDSLLFLRGGERLMTVFSDLSFVGDAERLTLARVAGEIDGFLLPYYTESATEYVTALVTKHKVRHLYLPTPESAGERMLYREMLAVCAEEHVKTTAYPRTGAFFFGSLTVSYLYAEGSAYGVGDVSLELLFGYTRIQYYSANALGLAQRNDTTRADVLILGCRHGPPTIRFLREAFVKKDAILVCPAPDLFPLYPASNVSFSVTRQLLIEQK